MLERIPTTPHIDERFNHILQVHEKFMESQRDILQAHLQTFMTEQEKLRSLMEGQYQEILSAISSKQNGSATAGVKPDMFSAVPQDASSPAPPEVVDYSTVDVESLVSAARRSVREADAVVRKQHVHQVYHLDMSTLPLEWASSNKLESDPNLQVTRPRFVAVRKFVGGPMFDIIMIFVILLNLALMFMSLQWQGYHLGVVLGKRSHDEGWQEHSHIFDKLEIAFCTVYVVEFCVRIFLLRLSYFSSYLNILDTFIVLAGAIETYVMRPTGLTEKTSNIQVGRLLRLLRVARVLKIVRFAENMSELRVLLRTLVASSKSLVWSLFLLSGIILASGILLFQSVIGFVEDHNNPIGTREWVYEHMGSTALSTMVMFEATFTTNWPTYWTRLVKEVSPYMSIFWVVYVVLVNFTVMRVIAALFLKDTMAVAASDAQKMAMQATKSRQAFADQIKEIFMEADTSGDGTISVEEFKGMLHNPHVGDCFQKLNLEVLEVATLFQLLASDDGQADYEEFLEGAIKLKNSARTIDIIQLLHEQMNLLRVVHELAGVVEGIACKLGLNNAKVTRSVESHHSARDRKSVV